MYSPSRTLEATAASSQSLSIPLHPDALDQGSQLGILDHARLRADRLLVGARWRRRHGRRSRSATVLRAEPAKLISVDDRFARRTQCEPEVRHEGRWSEPDTV